MLGSRNPSVEVRRRAVAIIMFSIVGVVAARGAQAQALFEVVHTFAGNESYANYAGLVQGPDGAFYGTSSLGGEFHRGSVFRMAVDGSVTVLHSFSGLDGGEPMAALIVGSDGNFYGTTQRGGLSEFGPGTVFRMTPAGVVTTLHAFTGGDDGKGPVAPLVQASDGNFYGTTEIGGGPRDSGTVFRVTLAGAFQTFHTFHGYDGGGPRGALIQATDGKLYGTTWSTYTDYQLFGGTVFSLSLDGTATTLYTFPIGGLSTGVIQGHDGALYGTTVGGPNFIAGTFFRLGLDGSFSALAELPQVTNQGPASGGVLSRLVQSTDGRFFVTTVHWVLQLTPLGTYKVAHEFGSYGDGAWPYGDLMQATDGLLYGTTAQGNGNVYRITPPPNGAPIAVNDSLTTLSGAAVAIPVLDNDSDPDGDIIAVANISAPSHGTVMLNPDNTISYVAAAAFNGIDTFTYAVTDGMADPSTATVTVKVGVPEQEPEPTPPPAELPECGPSTQRGTYSTTYSAGIRFLTGVDRLFYFNPVANYCWNATTNKITFAQANGWVDNGIDFGVLEQLGFEAGYKDNGYSRIAPHEVSVSGEFYFVVDYMKLFDRLGVKGKLEHIAEQKLGRVLTTKLIKRGAYNSKIAYALQDFTAFSSARIREEYENGFKQLPKVFQCSMTDRLKNRQTLGCMLEAKVMEKVDGVLEDWRTKVEASLSAEKFAGWTADQISDALVASFFASIKGLTTDSFPVWQPMYKLAVNRSGEVWVTDQNIYVNPFLVVQGGPQ